ncbi:hypothetical protein A6V37_19810 [Paraburkholderia ginsengiterrae]|uniref:Uncharacterized protein n=1 Tax=Paraburkholderia ginsengiterrae TaxID=1462993 RepID=A0A1A9NE87_9BURK|nr:hypothetical protein A6V37_19810 [Paraburkholderia ginsengiterrae]
MLIIPFSGAAVASEYRHSVLVFLGHDEVEWPEISSKFSDWAKKNVVPPRALLVAKFVHAHRLMDAVRDGSASGHLDILAKGKLVVAGFDCGGAVLGITQDDVGAMQDFTDLFGCAAKEFLANAAQRGGVVVAAPPGFYFAKQSDKYASHFLRAESLLSGTTEIELLSVALLQKFHQFCEQEKAAPAIRIFIDSMAIWPVAQMLVHAHCTNPSNIRRYSIESFRGYEGLENWDALPGPAFVIISASTSGGLETKVREKLGRSRNVPVVTLIGLENEAASSEDDEVTDDDRSLCLFRVCRNLVGEPALDGLRPEFQPNVTSLPAGAESVRVIGERFLSHNNRPKLVRLAQKSLAQKDRRTLATLAKAHMPVAARRKAVGNDWWSVSLDVPKLMETYSVPGADGACVLAGWIRNFAAPGPTVIVYPKDLVGAEAHNRLLAQRIESLLLERAPGTVIKVVDHTHLDKPEPDLKAFLKDAAAIVASPIVSNGFVFKQISAMLRLVQPSGPRLYIALGVLPESQARFKELSSDIGANADSSAYRFKYAFALPVGRIDRAIQWDQELTLLDDVIESCETEDIAVPKNLSGRRDAMRSPTGLTDILTFLPTSAGAPQPISAGFLLWDIEKPLAGDDFGASVLLTVAAFLEASRNARSGDVETSLRSGVFQHTLIEPATFTRFNDGAIQAAILRAAYASELDYSADRAASRDMARLISKFIELHDEPAGSAAAEFVLAILVGKLTLHRDDLPTILLACETLDGWLAVLAAQLHESARF